VINQKMRQAMGLTNDTTVLLYIPGVSIICNGSQNNTLDDTKFLLVPWSVDQQIFAREYLAAKRVSFAPPSFYHCSG
jgi:hypothetical protein